MRSKILIFFIIFFWPIISKAEGLSLIRDAEIEDFLYDIANPIAKVANLNPSNIKIYIINDSSLNAFVAGGQNIFINTGLITKYNDPDVLIGVIAHEIGHISSGHLARGSEDIKKATNTMLLSYIAGIATAAIASPDAGMAMILGGSQIATRTALRFTRSQEEAADLLALKYLKATNNSKNGLLKLLKFFEQEEVGYKQQIDEYALTHPVSEKRVSFIKLQPTNYQQKTNLDLKKRLTRIIAKLNAFLNDSDKTLKEYSDKNKNSQYAQAIAYYKKGNIQKAIEIVNMLITKTPKDNYLYDLKGQILFESGNIFESIISYNQAIKLNSGNNLAKIAMATSLIQLNSGDKQLIDFAIKNLLIAKRYEEEENIYQQLSRAYNQNGSLGKSYLTLAELNLLKKNKEQTKKYIELAKENLEKNDKISLLRLDDVEEFAKKI
jgi:predicted Zn-dependent protease